MKGCHLYFQRHDGQAVTIQDFVRAIEDASGVDLTQFCLWYHIPGRPKVSVQTSYANHIFTINIEQKHNRTDKPFVIPLAFGLVAKDGTDYLSDTLILDKKAQNWSFEVADKPVLSINRHFSALVDLDIQYTAEDQRHLIQHDSDLFNRFQVGYQYIMNALIQMIQNDTTPDEDLIQLMGSYLKDTAHPAFVAKAMTLPSVSEIVNILPSVNLERIYEKRRLVRQELAKTYHDLFVKLYDQNIIENAYAPVPEQASKRALKNMALSYLALTDNDDRIWNQYKTANNFTDLVEAFLLLVQYDLPHKTDALTDFFIKYENDDLTLNKWFLAQAGIPTPNTVQLVKKLMKHPRFDLLNPNRVRALLGVFSRNLIAFHQQEGYQLLADVILQLDAANPHMAANLVQAFSTYKKMDAFRRAQAQEVLSALKNNKKLTAQTSELIDKILAN